MGLTVQYYTLSVISTIKTKHSIKPGGTIASTDANYQEHLPLNVGLWATLCVSIIVFPYQVFCIEHSIVSIIRGKKVETKMIPIKIEICFSTLESNKGASRRVGEEERFKI